MTVKPPAPKKPLPKRINAGKRMTLSEYHGR
jgi:hypothetical protein